MEYQSDGLSREEIRKKRRKKERMQAIALFATILLVVLLAIGGVVFALVRVFTGSKDSDKDIMVDAVTTESVAVEDTASAEIPQEDNNSETEMPEETEDVDTEESGAKEADTEEGESEEPDSEETSLSDEIINDILGTEDKEALEKKVAEKISSMTLEEKVAGLFFVTPAQLMGRESDVTTVGSEFGDAVNQYPVGGIVLDESNMVSEEEFETLVFNLGVYIDEETFIGIENEGGEDAPFVAKGFSENVIASHQEIGANLGVSGAYSAGISLGSELRQYGIEVNFTPNVDVAISNDSIAAKEGFGVDAAMTAELGKNLVKGLSDQGISAAVGHFPSYGDVTHDGDGGQLTSNRTKEDLQKEYAPYLEAIDAGADFVVVSHVGLPKIRGDKRPASLSKEVITDIIRTEWEYDGIVITDFMNRSCMYQKYTYAEAAVGAIEAGADMILCPKNLQKSYKGIMDAINDGTLTEERIDESLKRIYRVKLSESATN